MLVKQEWTHKRLSLIDSYMDVLVLADLQKHTYIGTVRIEAVCFFGWFSFMAYQLLEVN